MTQRDRDFARVFKLVASGKHAEATKLLDKYDMEFKPGHSLPSKKVAS